MVTIIDGFLDKGVHSWICEGILENKYFPWYFQPATVPNPLTAPKLTTYNNNKPNERKPQYSYNHLIYLEEWSDWGHLVKPIIDKLDVNKVSRIKVNSVTKGPRHLLHGWHLDQAREGETKEDLKIAIYYLNTTNGYTLLEDGTQVASVANRLVMFDNTILHTCVSQTDEDRRVVINMNYY